MKFARINCTLLIITLLFSASCKQHTTKKLESTNPVYESAEVKPLTDKLLAEPDNAALYFQRGLILHKMQNDTLAINDFKKAASLDSTKAEYFSAVGDLLFEHKDINGSLPWIQHAIKLNPQDTKAHLKIAKMLVYTKDFPKAFAEINEVLRKNAMVPEGYFLKGMIYKDLKDTTKAISSFQTAIQVDPKYKDAIIQLGTIYSLKNNPLALEYFDNAFKVDTTDVFPIYAKGMFYQNQNKYEEAKAQYHDCIIRNTDYQDAYFSTGWILMHQDSLEKAWRQFDLVTKLDLTNYKAYYNRGLCKEMMGKKDEALSDYKQALSFNKDYKEASDGIKRLSIQ